jgi:uncharacterized sulfatase
MITRMDAGVGRIVDQLKELNLDDSTLVLFTSDNGPATGASEPDFFRAAGPLRGYKGSLFEGGIRVPLIARWPGKIQPGTLSDHVGYFADMMPTLAELAGESPPNSDGISLIPTLLGEMPACRKQQEHEFLYWEHQNAGLRAVRKGPWKAIRQTPDAAIELYHLERDLGESTDVAAQHADVVAELEKLLERAHTDARPQIEPEKPNGRRYQ